MRPILTVSALALLLAACEAELVEGKGDLVTETTAPADASSLDGEQALAAVEASTPAFAPDFPGAQVSSVTTRTETKNVSFEASTENGSKSDTGDVTRTDSKTFTTAESPDAVIQFYKKAAQGAGLRAGSEASSTDGTRSLEARGGERRLTVTATPEGGKTSATVSYTVPS